MIQANLCNKTAVVTGGGSGIGLACVTILAKSGAKVAVNHLPGDCVALQAIKELKTAGYDVVGAPGDVSDSASAKSMIQEAIQQLGGSLDFLINNAGTPGPTTSPINPSDLDRITDEFWHTVLNTNLIGTFTCAKTAAPALKQSGGCIVNIASISGISTQGSSIPYSASKSGVVSLTKSLARGLAPEVRVNAVAPGPTVTAWLQLSDSQKQGATDKSYLKRLSTPDDIAQTVLFLCAGSPMITGQTIIVDGGLTL
jgi:3-oxoacyl-[acyl-carrier protein] reductase